MNDNKDKLRALNARLGVKAPTSANYGGTSPRERREIRLQNELKRLRDWLVLLQGLYERKGQQGNMERVGEQIASIDKVLFE